MTEGGLRASQGSAPGLSETPGPGCLWHCPGATIAGMNRVLAMLLVAWSLVLAPALCPAGVLKHDCDGFCPEASMETTHHGGESACGHEAECRGDPCFNLATPGRGFNLQDCIPAGTAVACDTPDLLSVTPVFPILAVGLPLSSRHLSGRPFADRGLPLLI
jgi:hypothetical protein